MTVDEICEMAREAGKSGLSYQDFLRDDKIGEAFGALSESDMTNPKTTERIESAYAQGRQAFRQSGGWVVVWTTAKADYDQFDTEELECHEWHHKTLRKVRVHPDYAIYQRSRYLSGAAVWDEDPREVERKIQETIARENAEREEKNRVREAGLEWLRSADLSQRTDEDHLDRELRSRGLTWHDIRAEQNRRDEEREANERAALWNECRSMFADGCTIVDPGRDSIKGTHPETDPSIPGSDCAIYRNVRVVPHWSAKDDAGEARVVATKDDNTFDERRDFVGTLWFVAEYLKKGLLRIATADERLPPAVVMKRLRSHRLDDLIRCEIEGRVVWVGRDPGLMSFDILVLDEQGKLVRKKSIVEAAKNEYRTKKNYPF